jgi:hypothetical protein
MKHYSARMLSGAVRAVELQTPDEMKERLRAQLDGTEGGKVRLAARLGITCHRLTLLLRTAAPVPEVVAERLGYRPVVRFEPIDT